MEKGIGDGEGEGGRECKTEEEEWEILSTVREMGERGVESIEDGGSCGGSGALPWQDAQGHGVTATRPTR